MCIYLLTPGIPSDSWAVHRAVFPPPWRPHGWRRQCCPQDQHWEDQWPWAETASHWEDAATGSEIYHCGWGKTLTVYSSDQGFKVEPWNSCSYPYPYGKWEVLMFSSTLSKLGCAFERWLRTCMSTVRVSQTLQTNLRSRLIALELVTLLLSLKSGQNGYPLEDAVASEVAKVHD